MLHELEQALGYAVSGRPEGARLTITHIGAGGGGLLPLWARLQPAALLLVEGDPQLADALKRASATVPNCETMSVAIGPTAGTSAWYRYGLSALNGFVEMSALHRVYPRLRLLETFPQSQVPLAQVLSHANSIHHAVSRPGAAAWHVLVLDVPGQEDGLIGSLQASELNSWDALVVCGCGALPGSLAANAAVKRVQSLGGITVWTNADSELLWPVYVHFTQRSASFKILGNSSPLTGRLPTPSGIVEQESSEAFSLEREQELQELKRLRSAEASLRDELRALLEAHSIERARHDALQQQLADAEAQISLLKDVLLREAHR